MVNLFSSLKLKFSPYFLFRISISHNGSLSENDDDVEKWENKYGENEEFSFKN